MIDWFVIGWLLSVLPPPPHPSLLSLCPLIIISPLGASFPHVMSWCTPSLCTATAAVASGWLGGGPTPHCSLEARDGGVMNAKRLLSVPLCCVV